MAGCKHRMRGFSALELVIVLAIIVILAGIILTVGARARARAHQVADKAANGTAQHSPNDEYDPKEENDY